MSPVSSVASRPRLLTAAVAVSLAVTAGTLASAPVAGAASPAAVSASAATATSTVSADEVIAFPKTSQIVSSGETGFLSKSDVGEYRWTRYADGTSTVLASAGGPALGAASDVVVTQTGDHVVQIRDMATGAAPVEVPLVGLGGGVNIAIGAVGSTVLTSAHTVTGTEVLHVLSHDADGTLLNRVVTGIPSDATRITMRSAIPGTALVSYVSGTRTWYAVVDLATYAVVETYENPSPARTSPSPALSATHVAWVEQTPPRYGYPQPVVVVADRRRPGVTQRFSAGIASEVTVGLTGSWVVFEFGEDVAPGADRHPLVARSLTGAPGKELLEHATSLTGAPDGTLLVRGGSLVEGEAEGLYRVTAGEGEVGRQLVARSGEVTQLSVTGYDVPEVVDLDKNRPAVFTFDVDRPNVAVHMIISPPGQIDHYSYMWRGNGSSSTLGSLRVRWDGSYDYGTGDYGSSGTASNGLYEWKAEVWPTDGVGKAVELRGTFTVTRAPRPHDWTANAVPDLLSINAAGELIHNEDVTGWDSRWGTGWSIYDRASVPGDLGGTTAPDVVARDRSGYLWLYQGVGTSGNWLSARTRIGTGWQIYDKLVGGSDVNADGKADLLATDKSGVLWLYPGTGNVNTPFGARKKVGTGWGVYNEITATGNIAGAPAGDLVARDKDGVLWQYLGKGDGTFAPRTRIGGGWNAYSRIVAIGDLDNDGHNDLMAYVRTPSDPNKNVYVYKGTGSWSAPFGPRTAKSAAARDARLVF
ncbi:MULTISPECIES: FG-GAP-like repeat-containing protein [Streptomyces]|uniref:FG-GAP-like repeat-containing protein n=1 Tax=Streptomyces TaxID=1883 RepID=UPI000ACBC73D|nr:MULTISPECIES: FG-GAP-like repeat-containing protein [Streptomyces]